MKKLLVVMALCIFLFACQETQKPSAICTMVKTAVPVVSVFVAPLGGCDATALSNMIVADMAIVGCKAEKSNEMLTNISVYVCKTMINTMVGFGKAKLVGEAKCDTNIIDGLIGSNPADICSKISFK